MNNTQKHILLADDDIDDCDFFKDAIEEIGIPLDLTTVFDGADLMDFLIGKETNYPDVIFLDLNMPRKSGLECIAEIKSSHQLSHIPIIIYSTSLDTTVVNRLFDMGAHHYIQKPGEFSNLKMVIKKAITLFNSNVLQPPSRERFIIKP